VPADDHPLGGDIGLTAEALLNQLDLPTAGPPIEPPAPADEVMDRLGVEALRWGGIRFLRDHSARHRRDHILAVTLDQVVVIEARRARGTLALVEHGTPFRPDTRLELDGRDHSRVIDMLLARIPVVATAAQAASDDERVQPGVSGALCVLGAELRTHTVDWHIQAVTLHGLDSLATALGALASEVTSVTDSDEVDQLDRFAANVARRLL